VAIRPDSTAEPITNLAAFVCGWIDLEIDSARTGRATPTEIADSLARLRAHLTKHIGVRDVLRRALDESVRLQSHYAELLNMHDGGRRIGFADADAWIARLRETGTLPTAAEGGA
jgi:hypothetical protein